MSVNVRRDALAWHVIVYCQLVKKPEFLQRVVWEFFVGGKVTDESVFAMIEFLNRILKP